MNVQRLLDDPRPGLALLHRLRHDPSETVRRSVANHLNDVAKTHPELVVETVAAWMDEPATDHRMVAHALRTLVKRGEPGALAVLGFTTEPQVAVERFAVSPATVEMGEHITLAADLRSVADAPQRLVVDFVVHHVNASGATSPKVFKWTTVDLGPGEQRALTKRRLIQQASTRTYRAGTHRVELQVGGQVVAAGVRRAPLGASCARPVRAHAGCERLGFVSLSRPSGPDRQPSPRAWLVTTVTT